MAAYTGRLTGCHGLPMVLLLKTGIVLALLAIVASLFSGLVFLTRDGGQSRRTLRALTWRIGLSVGLFLLILLAVATGVLETNPSPLLTR